MLREAFSSGHHHANKSPEHILDWRDRRVAKLTQDPDFVQYLTEQERAVASEHLSISYEYGFDAGQLTNPDYKGKEV
jgi:hypothetical protein